MARRNRPLIDRPRSERRPDDVTELAAPPRDAGGAPPGGWRDDAPSRAAMTYGWTAIAAFLALGLALESFHLVKAPWYFEARLRRELWTLAHAHGTLLGLVAIAFAVVAPRAVPPAHLRRRFSRLLRAGALLVPAGFLLGGIGNAEGDPSPAILLVPLGAALALVAVAGVAWGLWRRR
jgi:hypothetical protein